MSKRLGISAIALWLAVVGQAHGQGWLERLLGPDAAPQAAPDEIVIRVVAPGMSPLEVERSVAMPLEEAARAARGIAQVTTTCVEGEARLKISLVAGAPLERAMSSLRSHVERARAVLPMDAEMPLVFAAHVHETKGWLIFTGEDRGARREALWRARIDEPAAGPACDWGRDQVIVEADPQRLRALGVSAEAISKSVRAHAIGISGMHVAPPASDPGALAKLAIAHVGGQAVTLGDVAEIRMRPDPEACRCRWRGQPAACAPLHRAFTARPHEAPPEIEGRTRAVAAPLGVQVSSVGEGLWAQIRGLPHLSTDDVVVEIEEGSSRHVARLWPVTEDEATARAWIGHWLEASRQRPGLHATPIGPALDRQRWVLTGGDERARSQALGDIRSWARRGRRALDVEGGGTDGQPELSLQLDQEAAARLGLTAFDVSRQVRLMSAEETLAPGGGRASAVVMRMKGGLEGPEAVSRLMLRTPQGQQVPLSAIATLEMRRAPRSHVRVNGQRAVVITVWGEGLGEAELSEAVALPAGVRLTRWSSTPARARR